MSPCKELSIPILEAVADLVKFTNSNVVPSIVINLVLNISFYHTYSFGIFHSYLKLDYTLIGNK